MESQRVNASPEPDTGPDSEAARRREFGRLLLEIMGEMLMVPGGAPHALPRPWNPDEDSALPVHEGHHCPDCGDEMFWCDSGGAGIRHSHRCAKCGKRWQHEP
jgi:hypothetical protein